MRIVVHDYSGHPFQVQLSRELARQGHDVLHLYSASFPTPKGRLSLRGDDAPSFEVEGIRLAEPFDKYNSFLHRRRQEIRYGKMSAERIAQYCPDVVLSGNTPLDAQKILLSTTHGIGAKFVFWLQDLYSVAIDSILRKRRFPCAGAIGAWYSRIEGRLLRASDAVVIVSPDFRSALERWDVMPGRVHTIPNWAPYDELRPYPGENEWARARGLAGKFVFLYSGTLGMKHNPRILVDLAQTMQSYPDVVVAVVSEGLYSDWVRSEAAARGIRNLRSFPLETWERMPEVLSAGSVLVGLLESQAGTFSVPSKVLSYLCAGRPILLSAPTGNLAARIVAESEAGLVVPANNTEIFLSSAHCLYRNAGMRSRCGRNAVKWAHREFDMKNISARFGTVFQSIGLECVERNPGMARMSACATENRNTWQ